MASASSAAAPDAPAWALLVPFASLALVLCIWAVASRLILLRSLAHIPGPAHSFARGALGALHRLPSLHDRRHACLRALHATYGRVVKVVLPFGAGAVVLCSRCAAVREDVLVKYTAFPHRPATLDLPLGLASLRLDAKYAACRAALARALSVEVLQAHHAGLCACADQLCEQLVRPPQQPESGIPAKSRARHDGVQQSEDPVEAAWDFKVSAPVAEVVFEALLLLFFGEVLLRSATLSK
ncbi:hypothetical protein T492DRAFT_843830 [Pavlovales sp. CCMP2436]|nr:hypothetical protein T492DRAFT_843830 [Pavlovales sp. CCMP2436]